MANYGCYPVLATKNIFCNQNSLQNIKIQSKSMCQKEWRFDTTELSWALKRDTHTISTYHTLQEYYHLSCHWM